MTTRPSGIPLLLLPGMNCSVGLWDTCLPALREAGARIVVADLDEPDLTRCVTSLADRMPPRFAVAGLSLGAIVAMAIARLVPERVTGLCLVATNSSGPTPQQREAWARQRGQLTGGRSAAELQRDLLPLLLSPEGRRHESRVLALGDATGESRLERQLRLQATRVDETPALASVAVPTLVVAGELDTLCPIDRHTTIRDAVPDAELVVISGSGHLVPIEAPGPLVVAMTRWLARVAGGGEPAHRGDADYVG